MKRAVIIGATSGIGYEVARILLKQGWNVGVAGRREERLRSLQTDFPSQVHIQVLDVTEADAPQRMQQLLTQLGGMDLFLLSSGIGTQNPSLEPETELTTARTNVEGFMRMVTASVHYFRGQGGGHLAVISSIAGTKGLGMAPAYSATKRFQNTYIEALSQLSHMEKWNIRFTDIRPGFVATALLKDANYPMLMQLNPVALHIVRALERKQRIVTIDWRYRLLVFFWRMIPRAIWERLPIRNA